MEMPIWMHFSRSLSPPPPPPPLAIGRKVSFYLSLVKEGKAHTHTRCSRSSPSLFLSLSLLSLRIFLLDSRISLAMVEAMVAIFMLGWLLIHHAAALLLSGLYTYPVNRERRRRLHHPPKPDLPNEMSINHKDSSWHNNNNLRAGCYYYTHTATAAGTPFLR